MNICYLYVMLQMFITGQAEYRDMPIIVLNSGSESFEAGFAGDEQPRDVFKPVIGRRKKKLQDKRIREVYVGAAAENLGQSLDLSFPIRNGIIKNWEDMKVLWNITFVEGIHVNPEEHPILLTELPMNSRENRQKMAEIMFDVFNIPALYIANQALMALYSTDRNTGVVLFSGYDVTYSVPIFEGQVVSDAVLKLNLGGRDLINFLIKIIKGKLKSTRMRAIADDIKGKLCYVALDFEQELLQSKSSSSLRKSYELPDGKIIILENERFRCPELLFNPTILGKNISGIHDLLYNSIMKCNFEQRAKMYGNIVLTGGSISFPGMAERMMKEIKVLAPPAMHVKVVAPQWKPYLTWIGGSKFASQPTFGRKTIKREKYRKFGPSNIH